MTDKDCTEVDRQTLRMLSCPHKVERSSYMSAFAALDNLVYPTRMVPSSEDSRAAFPDIAHAAEADVIAAGAHLAFVADADGISRAVLVRA